MKLFTFKLFAMFFMLGSLPFPCNLLMDEKPQTTEKLFYYKSGERRMRKFVNHKTKTYEGDFTMWHKNGKVALKGLLKNGERNGKITYFDKAGIPNCYAYYNVGVKVGTWIYLENKDTTKILIYDKGKLISEEIK